MRRIASYLFEATPLSESPVEAQTDISLTIRLIRVPPYSGITTLRQLFLLSASNHISEQGLTFKQWLEGLVVILALLYKSCRKAVQASSLQSVHIYVTLAIISSTLINFWPYFLSVCTPAAWLSGSYSEKYTVPALTALLQGYAYGTTGITCSLRGGKALMNARAGQNCRRTSMPMKPPIVFHETQLGGRWEGMEFVFLGCKQREAALSFFNLRCQLCWQATFCAYTLTLLRLAYRKYNNELWQSPSCTGVPGG